MKNRKLLKNHLPSASSSSKGKGGHESGCLARFQLLMLHRTASVLIFPSTMGNQRKGASFPSTTVDKNGFLELENADMNLGNGIRCRYRLLARPPPFSLRPFHLDSLINHCQPKSGIPTRLLSRRRSPSPFLLEKLDFGMQLRLVPVPFHSASLD